MLLSSLVIASGCSSNSVDNSQKEDTIVNQEAESNINDTSNKFNVELNELKELLINQKYEEAISKMGEVRKLEGFTQSEYVSDITFYQGIADNAIEYQKNPKLNDYIRNLATMLTTTNVPASYIEVLNSEKMVAKKRLIELIDDRKLMEVVESVGVWDSDPEFKALKNYAGALYNHGRKDSVFYSYLSKIPEGYDGILSEKINELVNSNTAGIVQETNRQEGEILRKKIEENSKNPGGVHIGMTKGEVLTNGWGQPSDINKTTTAYGTREQWVYGGGNYLYFEDGILTSIQN